MVQVSRERVWIAADRFIIILTTALEEMGRFPAHDRKINQMVANSGSVWTCSDDGSIAVWEKKSFGTLIRRLRVHLKEAVCLLLLGKFIISGSSDNSVIVWDARNMQPIQELEGYHNGTVKSLLTVLGCLWSASFDQTIVLWSLNPNHTYTSLQDTSRTFILPETAGGTATVPLSGIGGA